MEPTPHEQVLLCLCDQNNMSKTKIIPKVEMTPPSNVSTPGLDKFIHLM
jgi:hypothetical protein